MMTGVSEALTANRLRELLVYDAETGIFLWKHRIDCAPQCNTRWAGKVAGTLGSDGYLKITIDYRQFGAHRLAWLHVHGVWPADQIDHIDGNRANNAITNLREATNSQNNANAPAQANSTTGVRGVTFRWRIGRYQVQLFKDGAGIHGGYFTTLEEAAIAARRLAQELHGEFAHNALLTERGAP
jgi:hypothetical protein